MKRILTGLVFGVVAFGVAACGDPSKQDIVKKAENASTRAQLESALGKPDDMSKLGPIEKWSYKASDGTVTFVITGDTVAIQAASGSAADK
ncbi:MAG: hypothetical protein OQJ99_01455 [Rhodospirillales bacterium]|nr:hypothetical protein [Rhodospirillales bacterium]MCW8861743.1 hypothetical protein [Rhodospirillales bacterium]MCW8951657.1 hypothetical protein [Rhodospirillales bacterium]MCW8970099.1 hypothetical protein [Rhodospirillales bacterium]MCW9001607.1 hypothetical protein [Rhodospirillales bacterium]